VNSVTKGRGRGRRSRTHDSN